MWVFRLFYNPIAEATEYTGSVWASIRTRCIWRQGRVIGQQDCGMFSEGLASGCLLGTREAYLLSLLVRMAGILPVQVRRVIHGPG